MSELKITERQNNDVTILDLSGEITVITQNILRHAISGMLIQNRNKMILNFDQVDLVSKNGLKALSSYQKYVQQAQGHMVLTQGKELWMMGADRNEFEMVETEEEALALFAHV